MSDLTVTSSDVLEPSTPSPETEEKPNEPSPETQPKADDSDESKAKEETAEEKETARERHNRRQWERLTRERAEYKAKAELLESMQQRPQQPKEGRPERDNFDNDEDYVDALTDWKLEQKMGAFTQKVTAQTRQQQVEQEFSVRMQAAEKAIPDFKEVLENATDIPMTPEMQEAIKSSDLGPELAYHLAKNPDDALRLSQMTPIAAARELGRLESYLEYEKSQKQPPRISKAPPPPRLPGGGTTRTGTKSLAEMSYDEYVKARRAMKSPK